MTTPFRPKGALFDSFDDDAEAAMRSAAAGSPLRGRLAVHLTTAADLAGGQGAVEAAAPDRFAQGMRVLHPEYGLGRIVVIGGSGARRTATAQFAGCAGEKRFVLSQSRLRPVGPGE